MATIQVTPDLLQGKATELRGYKAEHDEAMAKIRALVNGLSDIWKGEAQTAYQGKFDSMQSTFTQFSEMLEGYAKLMDEVAKTMAETDMGGAQRIGAFGG